MFNDFYSYFKTLSSVLLIVKELFSGCDGFYWYKAKEPLGILPLTYFGINDYELYYKPKLIREEMLKRLLFWDLVRTIFQCLLFDEVYLV